jgi:hypothetical protein
MFTKDYLLSSDWYQERLKAQQKVDIRLWTSHVAYLKSAIDTPVQLGETFRRTLEERKARAERTLADVSAPGYVNNLTGFIGADPSVLVD